MKISRIFISPGHNFFGHHGEPPGTHGAVELERAECVAGRGIRGDRFFDFKENYKGQITFFSLEVFEGLVKAINVAGVDPSALRRNVITSGIDLNTIIGKEFEVQGVRFLGMTECTPCYWMDQAIGPGAESWLKGNGGLRAQILTDGWLTVDR